MYYVLLFLVFVQTILAVKLLNTSLSSSETLTACVERMALRACIYPHGVAFDGGASLKGAAAGRANHFNSMVVGVNSFFHVQFLLPP